MAPRVKKQKNKSSETSVNLDLWNFLINSKNCSIHERTNNFYEFINNLYNNYQNCYLRQVISSADREITIYDTNTSKLKKMLMFGSNNYLGLATHPHVCEMVKKTVNKYGVGIGGPPLLNGYTKLTRELEERLSAIKQKEDSLIFSSGYNTNIGLVGGLLRGNNVVVSDEYSHASFYDGIRLAKTKNITFQHNNTNELNALLANKELLTGREPVVNVEGVYSMDGDFAPLDEIVTICKKNKAMLIIDDAHGTGVMGKNGNGTCEHFNVAEEIDIVMGTLSKTFAVTGGFISASKPIINYLRYFARPYMFSASLPPMTIAAVLAGLDVIQNEPELRQRLHKNVKYTVEKLNKCDIIGSPKAGIIALRIPEKMDIRKAAYQFHKEGIFLNAIEYPAVPKDKQRFRISVMANHTQQDLDKLIHWVNEIWSWNV